MHPKKNHTFYGCILEKYSQTCKEDQPVSLNTSTVAREPGSVTNILKDLKLPTLEIRRKIERLCLFHKAFHHQVAINIPDYIKQQNRTTRQYHPQKFRNVDIQ